MHREVELWQAYDENCKPVHGQGLTRETAYTGKLHGAAQVWLWRHMGKDVEVLLQFRSKSKKTWPNHWDISAAGHIDLYETPDQAAIREASEELGINIKAKDLSRIFVYHANYVDSTSQAVENEWQFVYLAEVSNEQSFTFTDGEVDLVKWVQIDELEIATKGKSKQIVKLVPHGDEYYSQVISYLRQKL